MKHGLLKTKLALLLEKRKRITRYDLSGTAWQDHYSTRERDIMEKKAENAEKKYFNNERKIIETIEQLISSSYSIDVLVSEFPEVASLIEKLNTNHKKR